MRRWAEAVTNSWMGRLVYRVVGQPPPEGSPLLDQLVWVRRFYTRPLPAYVGCYMAVLVTLSPPSNWAIVAFGVLTWAWGFASISARIRNERRKA